MNKDPEQHRKSILRDPVTAYRDLVKRSGDKQHDQLTALWATYREQLQQKKELQEQSQQISRKIGEIKRRGLPIDELKMRMQAISSQVKTVNLQLQDLEDQILAFFADNDANAGKERSTPSDPVWPPQRHYPGQTAEMAIEVSVTLLNSAQPEDLETWNRYTTENPAASIYHRAEWQGLIHKTFGHEGYYFQARNSTNKIVGILPLIRLKSRLFGDFLISMPYFNYGGAIADNPVIEQLLIETANTRAADLGVSHIEYRDDIPRPGLPVRTDKVNMILSLPNHEDVLWKGFTSKLRAQIRRPQRENPQVLTGQSELLEDFYSVFARNMRDLGTPVYGKSFFHNILQTFPEQSQIIVLRLSKRPVAAAFLLGYGNTLEIPWASTVREVNHLSLNMLMYWEVLRFAIKNGFNYFDFGRSSKESGTYRFKQQWGARPKPLFWHYWLANGSSMPSLNPNNPKYALMIAAWKRLPVSVSKWLGPMIVKNLP